MRGSHSCKSSRTPFRTKCTSSEKPATLPRGGFLRPVGQTPASPANARHEPTWRVLRRKLGDARCGIDLEAEHDMVGARVFGILSSSPAISALVPNSSLVKAPACPSAAFSSPAAIGDSPNFSMCSSYSHFRFHACFLGRYITSVNFAPSPGFDETMASPPCNCAMCLTMASPSPVPPSALLRSLSIR